MTIVVLRIYFPLVAADPDCPVMYTAYKNTPPKTSCRSKIQNLSVFRYTFTEDNEIQFLKRFKKKTFLIENSSI